MASWTQHPQWHTPHLYLLEPEVVYSAQVHADTLAYGRWMTRDIWWLLKPKNATGTLLDVEAGMTVLLGSTPGGRDYGLVRAKGYANDATLGYCLQVWASQGANDGELAVVEDAYITVLDDYRVHAKIPQLLDDGTIFKDALFDYTYNTPPPPVANAGVGFAGEVDSATNKITVPFDASRSFAVAHGATIVAYQWDVKDGTVITGTASDAQMTAEFGPGKRWVTLTVTDSNGKTALARVLVVGIGASVTYSESDYSGGTAVSSSNNLTLGVTADAAFDGSNSYWMSNNEDVGAWIGMTWASPQTFAKAGWIAAGGDANTPKSCVLEADTTNDGVYDTTVATWTDEPNDATEKTATFTPLAAYRWRLRFTAVFYDGSALEGRGDDVYLSELNLYEVASSGSASEVTHFEVVRRVLRQEGQELTLRVYEDIPADEIPYGTLVMLWEDEYYGAAGEAGNLYGPSGREHMRFVGWLGDEPARIEAGENGTRAYVELQCLDVAGRLAMLPVFPMGLMRTASPSNFDEMAYLNPDRYTWFILHWHSTALELADFVWSGTLEDYAIPLLSTQGDSLYSQADFMAQAIAHRLTCDSRGRLAMRPDPQLQALASRTAVILQSIGDDDWMGIQYTETRSSRYHWLWNAAIVASTSQAADVSAVQGVYCRAPGSVPGQGLQMVRRSEQVVVDQDELNTREGMRYAVRLNPDQSFFEVLIAHGNDGGIEPALMQWVPLTVSPAYAAQRGLSFTAARFLPYEVVIDYHPQAQAKTTRLRLEREASGPKATTYVPDVGSLYTYDDSWYVGETDLPGGLYGDLVAARNEIAAVLNDGRIAVTRNYKSATPNWHALALTFDGTIQQFVVDAFSPGYIDGSGAVNGWVVTTTSIYKVSDIFGDSPSATLQFTFRTPSGSIRNHSVDASFGSEGHVVVVSYYGADGTWATYTTDGGATWATEVQITSFSQTDTLTYADIFPGVHVSSKTAGLVYTSAFKSDNNGAGYVSPDYGATWTETNGSNGPVLNTGIGLADDIHVPYGLSNELTAYHGTLNFGTQSAATFTNAVSWEGVGTVTVAPDGPVNTVTWTRPQSQFVIVEPIFGMQSSAPVTEVIIGMRRLDLCPTVTGEWATNCPGDATTNLPSHILKFTDGTSVGPGNGDYTNLGVIDGYFQMRFRVGTARYVASLHLYGGAYRGSPQVSGPEVSHDQEYKVISTDADTGGAGYALQKAAGATITDVSPGDGAGHTYGPYGRSRWRLKTCPTDASRVLAVVGREGDTGARVFLSTDGGANWLARSDDNSPYRRGSIAGDDPNVLYVWGDGGAIAVSADGGMTWENKQGDLSGGEIVGICGGTA